MPTWLLTLLAVYFSLFPFVLAAVAPRGGELGVLIGLIISWLIALGCLAALLPRSIADLLDDIERHRRRHRE